MLRQRPKRVLKDLHDGLQVQVLLQQDEKSRIKSRSGITLLNHTKTPRTTWQLFLDDLCLLCDSHRGGATTTSIGAEQRPGKVVFWMAMNEGDLEQAKKHLEHVLDVVQYGNGEQEESTSNLALEIFTQGVKRSPQRIENYAGRLSNVLKEMGEKSDPTFECEFWIRPLPSNVMLI